MTALKFASALAAAVLLAGCGTAGPVSVKAPAITSQDAAPQPAWAPVGRPHGQYLTAAVFEDGDPADLVAGPDGARIGLTFGPERLSAATAGCATLDAPYELRGGRLRVGRIAGRDGGCAGDAGGRPPREAQHRMLADFLAADPAWYYQASFSGASNPILVLGTATTWMRLAPRDAVQPGVAKPVGDFVATAATENGAPYPIVGRPFGLTFSDGGDGTAYGGCNWHSGIVRFVDGRIAMRFDASTLVGCSGDQDRWFTAFIGTNPAYIYDGTNLVLESPTARIEFGPREVVRPDLPLLDGTYWELESREGRHSADASAKSWLEPRHRFNGFDDGGFTLTQTSISGTLGCAAFAGPIELGPDTIRFGALDVDRSGCRAPKSDTPRAPNADWILRVLSGERAYDVDDRRLTVHDPATGDRVVLAGDTAAERAERERRLAER